MNMENDDTVTEFILRPVTSDGQYKLVRVYWDKKTDRWWWVPTKPHSSGLGGWDDEDHPMGPYSNIGNAFDDIASQYDAKRVKE